MTDDFVGELPKDSWRETGKSLLHAGSGAASKATELLVAKTGGAAADIAAKATGNPETLSHGVIEAHTLLARGQGLAVASSLTVAEVGSVVGTAGTLTPAAIAAGLMADLTGLAWIQIRMVLIIAALHGFDPRHPDRVRELGALMGMAGAAQGVTERVKQGAPKALERMTLRYLKGDSLKAVKAMFSLVGIKFTRTAFVKQLPLVNIPISVVVNGAATKSLGKRALSYYHDLSLVERGRDSASR
jgi:hypothetical protein